MARKNISESVQSEILLKSKRRCCICIELFGDHSVKKGQIAHLDKNSENSKPDNLVFLCFDHHDQYDSQTSQSKGLTKTEILTYRERLYEYNKESVSTTESSQRLSSSEKIKNANVRLQITKLAANALTVMGGKSWQVKPFVDQMSQLFGKLGVSTNGLFELIRSPLDAQSIDRMTEFMLTVRGRLETAGLREESVLFSLAFNVRIEHTLCLAGCSADDKRLGTARGNALELAEAANLPSSLVGELRSINSRDLIDWLKRLMDALHTQG